MEILSQAYDVADGRAKEVDAQAKIPGHAWGYLHYWLSMTMVRMLVDYLPLDICQESK